MKQRVSQAVLQRKAKVIKAESMYKYLLENFTFPVASSFEQNQQAKSVELKRQVFFFVPSQGEGAVDKNRPGRQFKLVTGIRKSHCVKSLPQREKILTRHRSCYCPYCIIDDEDECKNKEWVDEWKKVEIKREASPAITRQSTATSALDNDTSSYIADLAARGSTVAIAAFEDPAYDFFLLKVTSDDVEELEKPLTDDYHCHYPSGSAVLKGHFFLRENLQDMTYTIDAKRVAMVYAGTVCAICTEANL